MSQRRQDFETAIMPYKDINVTTKKIRRLIAIIPTNIITQMVRIDINGTQFVLRRSTCIKIPVLCRLLTNVAPNSVTAVLGTPGDRRQINITQQDPNKMVEFSFKKSSEVFAAVVDYVHNHELHAPQLVCPKLFARDLRFWGFDVKDLAPCCYAGVLRFLYEQDKKEKFHGFLKSKSRYPDATDSSVLSCFQWIRISMWTFLERPFENRAARIYFFVTVFSVLGSFLSATAETLEIFTSNKTTTLTRQLTLFFIHLDHACIGFQCLDLLLHLLFSPDPCWFLCNIINLTDGLAAVAAVVKLILPVLLDCDPNQFLYKGCGQALNSSVYMINVLQLLRILRILRPISQLMQFRLLFYTMRSSLTGLCLVFLLLGLLAMVFSTAIYYLGSKKAISNIPEALWYSIITLTTVGYGDVVPDDWVSRVLGCAMAVLGVIVFAVTTPIFVSNFHSLYLHAIVGEPTTIKHLQRQLCLDIKQATSGTASKSLRASSLAPKLDQRLGKRRSRDRGWCTRVCCRSSRRNRVLPQEKRDSGQSGRMSMQKTVEWKDLETDLWRRKAIQINLSGSERDYDSKGSLWTSPSTGTNSPLADSEGEAEAGSSPANTFSNKVFQMHQNMLQPRHRSWFYNYDISSSDESGHEPPTNVIQNDTGEKCTWSLLDGQGSGKSSHHQECDAETASMPAGRKRKKDTDAGKMLPREPRDAATNGFLGQEKDRNSSRVPEQEITDVVSSKLLHAEEDSGMATVRNPYPCAHKPHTSDPATASTATILTPEVNSDDKRSAVSAIAVPSKVLSTTSSDVLIDDGDVQSQCLDVRTEFNDPSIALSSSSRVPSKKCAKSKSVDKSHEEGAQTVRSPSLTEKITRTPRKPHNNVGADTSTNTNANNNTNTNTNANIGTNSHRVLSHGGPTSMPKLVKLPTSSAVLSPGHKTKRRHRLRHKNTTYRSKVEMLFWKCVNIR